MTNYSIKRFLTLLGLTVIAPQLTTWSTVSEEDPASEVINTINSPCRYRGTTNILKGQMLIYIQIEIMVIHTTALLVNIIHPVLLGIPLAQVIIKPNPIATQSPNSSNIVECLQSQILGLQIQALQQSTLNSIKIFNGNNESQFTSWAQSVENAAKLCKPGHTHYCTIQTTGTPI